MYMWRACGMKNPPPQFWLMQLKHLMVYVTDIIFDSTKQKGKKKSNNNQYREESKKKKNQPILTLDLISNHKFCASCATVLLNFHILSTLFFCLLFNFSSACIYIYHQAIFFYLCIFVSLWASKHLAF